MRKRPKNGGTATARPLDVFVPRKGGKGSPKQTAQASGPEIAPDAGRRRSLDVFTPVKKSRPPTYMDERAAVLGSNNLAHPWACEPADDRTMGMLAQLAGTTVADLQWRRNPRDPQCPERVPVTRRRCLHCPFWARHPEVTPWDGNPLGLLAAVAEPGGAE